jgi:hypothetical protein
MITFLHTSAANVQRFDDLVRKYDQDIEIKHFVNEDLLSYALANGKADLVAFEAEAQKVKEVSSGTVVCTCSSYGDASDTIAGIERIDRPVVAYLVQKYSRIGLAYTAGSTWEASRKLVITEAEKIGKNVEVIKLDCTSCWNHFANKHFEEYEQGIAQLIKNDQSNAEAIFLAQASMQNAKRYLENYEKEVLASPEFGVKTYLDRM